MTKNILLVSRDFRFRTELSQKIKTTTEITPIIAETAERALINLLKWKIDILVTDVELGEVDGVALMMAAKKLYPDLAVFVFLDGAAHTLTEIMEKGADLVLTKAEADLVLLDRLMGLLKPKTVLIPI